MAFAIVVALALLAPAYAFAAAILLFALEGSLKVLVSAGGLPVGVSPTAFVAATLDLALLIAVGNLWLRRRRGVRLALTRDAWAAVALVSAWVALSLAQLATSPDFSRAVVGLRVTQMYVLAALGGYVLLATRRERDGLLRLLLVGFAGVAAYGVARGIIGTSDLEQAYARTRETTTHVRYVFRTTGTFSAAVGMASFMAPAAVFALTLALLHSRLRWTAVPAVALGVGAVIATYVRVGLMALVAGAAVVLLALLFAPALPRRERLASAAMLGVVAIAGGATTVAVSQASPPVAERLRTIFDPGGDESMRTRLDTWARAVDRIRDAPLGTGLGTVGRASGLEGQTTETTDNSYLKVFREQGVAVGFLFVAGLITAWFAVLKSLLKRSGERFALGVAAMAAFSAFLALCAMGEYIEQPGKVVAWTSSGVAFWAAFAGAPDSESDA